MLEENYGLPGTDTDKMSQKGSKGIVPSSKERIVTTRGQYATKQREYYW